MRVRLPDKDLTMDQNLRVPALQFEEEIVDLHFSLATSLMRRPISALRAGITGSDGSVVLFESRSEIKLAISGVRQESKFFLKPAGIEVFAASSNTLLKTLTARAAEAGGGKEQKRCSVSEVYKDQSARWKFV